MMNKSILSNKLVILGIISLLGLTSFNPLISMGTAENQSYNGSPLPPGGDTLYVGGNGSNNYSKIQDAIDDASDFDTVFVYNDSSPYYENIVVDKSINLIGENKDTTIIDGSEEVVGDVVYVSTPMVTISGFTVRNCGLSELGNYDAGIEIQSDYTTIVGNNILNNTWGILAHGGSHTTILENTFTNNSKRCIELKDSEDNIVHDNVMFNNDANGILIYQTSQTMISQNTIFDNSGIGLYFDYSSFENTVSENIISENDNYGAYLRFSSNITLTRNTIANNTNGVYLYLSENITINKNTFFANGIVIMAAYLNNWNTHTIEGNIIDGRQLRYYKNTNNVVIPKDIGQLILANCTKMTVQNLDLSHGDTGIQIAFSSYNYISNNNIMHGRGRGICLRESHHNTIKDNTITHNMGIGMELAKSVNNTIIDNTITNNNAIGIKLWYSSDNNIIGNNIRENGDPTQQDRAIDIMQSSNLAIQGNTIAHNTDGIYLQASANETINDNVFFSNGIQIFSSWISHWNTHTMENNTINGYAFRYYKDTSDLIVPVDTGQVILANCSNITIQNLNLSTGTTGIQLAFSTYILISANKIAYNNWHGIYGLYSSNNTIINNSILGNKGRGLWLVGSSSNNEISDNGIMDNRLHGILLSGFACDSNTIQRNLINNNVVGIYIMDSKKNDIFLNRIEHSNGSGIGLDLSSDTTISKNIIIKNGNGIFILGDYDFPAENITINDNEISYNTVDGISTGAEFRESSIFNNNVSHNGMDGIHFVGVPPLQSYPHDNYIFENNVHDNDRYGIRLYYNCRDNTIYHNNVFDNGEGNGYDFTVLSNIWDNGMGEGNYWDDYTGSDNNGDGIGDTPYDIHGGDSQDRYPLMFPYGSNDEEPPTVEIKTPEEGFIYIKNKKAAKRPFIENPLIFGRIDIEVNASDSRSGVNRVEFYIDGELRANITTPPYTWIWKRAFFKHTIKVVAFDNEENTASDELVVCKFF